VLSLQQRSFGRSLLIWLRHLGGPGLVLLGLLDNSVVPVPGSMDALTIVLAANQRKLWVYYAAMATVGAVIGGYMTYRIAQKQGKEHLETRVPRNKMRKVEKVFGRWGFGAIAIAAMLPPPAPMVPFLIAAGAAQYSRNKFLAALAVGRGIRYSALALLGAIYGRQIIRVLSEHAKPFLIVVGICIAAGVMTLLFLRRRKSKHAQA
jgi:membrane protein DedA with SNARE-associated domain